MSDNQLVAERSPGIGHNQPPLGEQIDEILAPLRERRTALLEVAEGALIIDAESAEKVTDLVKQMQAWEKELGAAHDALKRPYLEACQQIDKAFTTARARVVTARSGENGRGGLTAMLTEYQRRLEREAEEAQRVFSEQQPEEAAAFPIRPVPIRSHLGTVGWKRQIVVEITDLRKLLGWMLKSPLKGQVEESAKSIIGRYFRNLGVDSIGQRIAIPGCEARVERVAQVR